MVNKNIDRQLRWLWLKENYGHIVGILWMLGLPFGILVLREYKPALGSLILGACSALAMPGLVLVLWLGKRERRAKNE